jgi:hypothetical protein
LRFGYHLSLFLCTLGCFLVMIVFKSQWHIFFRLKICKLGACSLSPCNWNWGLKALGLTRQNDTSHLFLNHFNCTNKYRGHWFIMNSSWVHLDSPHNLILTWGVTFPIVYFVSHHGITSQWHFLKILKLHFSKIRILKVHNYH